MERRILLSSINPGHPLRTMPLQDVPGITAFDTANDTFVEILHVDSDLSALMTLARKPSSDSRWNAKTKEFPSR